MSSRLRAPMLAFVPFVVCFAPASAQVTNVPVAPETIYVARRGAQSGLSVIDLNGFGGGTGNPAFDLTYQTFPEGSSNFPNDPNVRYQGSLLRPVLRPGTTTRNGGSGGVFTLAKNSALDDLLLHDPQVASVGDMMLGHALDSTYNDGPAPFGCQSGGGNLCATTGLKMIDIALFGQATLQPAYFGGELLNSVIGGENPISWAPHPNPPPLLDPPPCLDPLILGQEPTAFETLLPPPDGPGLSNLLVPGDPFGDPSQGIPPSGLLGSAQRLWFIGPSGEQLSLPLCQPFQVRQQIGHFLYLTDVARDRIVVVNSNTMRVLAEIVVEDPTELAMSPNLDRLAVSQRSLDQVAFVDIDPASQTFHQVVATTPVGDAPAGIAWDPGNEDVLVCNEGSSTVSILSAASLSVRKTVHRGLDRPFALAITQRQARFGHERNVYFAYILDRSGHVSLFESGPDGSPGWGFDEIIGRTTFVFPRAKAIQPDPLSLSSGVWIVHQEQLASDGSPTGLHGGAVSDLVLDASITGPIRLLPAEAPNMRGLSFRIARSVGSDQLTGIPVDLAFDDLHNLGGLENLLSPFSAASPLALNGKSLVRALGSQGFAGTNQATYLFVPVRRTADGVGAVDVIELASGLRVDTNAHHDGVQSIPADGAAIVMDYFRQ